MVVKPGTKKLVAIAFATLLSIGVLGLAHHAYAQDGDISDQSMGAWHAPAASEDESSAEAKMHPLNIAGCWSGEVDDTGDGTGTAAFQFDHHSNRKKLVIGSTFDFEWGDGAFARGPLKGTVSSTGFRFKGNAGADCAVSGSGTGNATALTGMVVFAGTCASIFQNVTFSITPGCM